MTPVEYRAADFRRFYFEVPPRPNMAHRAPKPKPVLMARPWFARLVVPAPDPLALPRAVAVLLAGVGLIAVVVGVVR